MLRAAEADPFFPSAGAFAPTRQVFPIIQQAEGTVFPGTSNPLTARHYSIRLFMHRESQSLESLMVKAQAKTRFFSEQGGRAG